MQDSYKSLNLHLNLRPQTKTYLTVKPAVTLMLLNTLNKNIIQRVINLKKYFYIKYSNTTFYKVFFIFRGSNRNISL